MTIGIAASGPHAGAAVRAAIVGAELLGRGAIGGFAVFAVLDEKGELRHCVTQRGGITQLAIPPAWLAAPIAAAISSGPDRPEPLIQFLPGATGIGLVTGHRLPNRPGRDGTPLNQAVLALLAAGRTPRQAVDSVLGAHPESDAGLIAIGANGELAMGNSARVQRRDDLGSYQGELASCRLAMLHNSIYARSPLADDIAQLAWAHLSGQPAALRLLTLAAPVSLRAAGRDRVMIDAAGNIVALETADPNLPAIERRSTVVYLGAEVWRDGRAVGRIATELYAEIAGGRVLPGADPVQNMLAMSMNHVAP
jgi:hypothetical protein